jgi:hypothetical protein
VYKAAGETETTQGNIQNWFQLNETDPEFQLLKEEELLQLHYEFTFIATKPLGLFIL